MMGRKKYMMQYFNTEGLCRPAKRGRNLFVPNGTFDVNKVLEKLWSIWTIIISREGICSALSLKKKETGMRSVIVGAVLQKQV